MPKLSYATKKSYSDTGLSGQACNMWNTDLICQEGFLQIFSMLLDVKSPGKSCYFHVFSLVLCWWHSQRELWWRDVQGNWTKGNPWKTRVCPLQKRYRGSKSTSRKWTLKCRCLRTAGSRIWTARHLTKKWGEVHGSQQQGVDKYMSAMSARNI